MTPALGRDLGHGMQCDLDLITNIYLNSSNGVLGESQLLPLCLIGNETWEQVGKPRRATCQDEKGKTRQDGLDEGSGHYSTEAGAGKILPSHSIQKCSYLLSQMERIITRKENGIPAMKSVFGEVLSRINWERKWKCD